MVGLVQHVFSNTIVNATGTVTIWNTAGVSTTVAATDIVRPQDWNSTHNQSLTITGNTIGNTSVISGTNIVLSGGPGIRLSGDSANSRVGFQLAGAPANAWAFPNIESGQNNLSVFAPTTASLLLYPWYPLPDVSWSNVILPISLSASSSAGATSNSGGYSITFGLYSLTGLSLSSMTTATAQIKYSYTSNSITYTVANGASSFSSSGSANSSLFNGPIFWYIPWATSVSGGGTYYIGFDMSAAGQVTAASAGFQMSLFGMAAVGGVTSWGKISSGGASAAALRNTDRWTPVLYSTSTTNFPASIPIGSTNSALNYVTVYPLFEIANS